MTYRLSHNQPLNMAHRVGMRDPRKRRAVGKGWNKSGKMERQSALKTIFGDKCKYK